MAVEKPVTGLAWLRRLFSGQPHFIIGGEKNPYMLRWYLIPRNRWFNIYLHKFLRSDYDGALHDHPWHSTSIILKGEYLEILEPTPKQIAVAAMEGKMIQEASRFCRRWSVWYRRPEHRHRIVLFGSKRPIPVWTLFVTGRVVRDWGFWCKGEGDTERFVPWKEFVGAEDTGDIGRGCGDA